MAISQNSILVTAGGSTALTNKTIDASSNTISNIVNANVSSSAVIAYSKLAALTSANILVGSASNVATVVAVTGDVALTNAGVTSVGDTVVTGKLLTNFSASAGSVSATDSILIAFNKVVANIALKAPLASPTFTGTVTLPSGTVSSSAWDTGTSTFSSGGKFSLSLAKASTYDANYHSIIGNVRFPTSCFVGAAGSGYPYVGYNARPTSTTAAYTYDSGDGSAIIQFGTGAASGYYFILGAAGSGGSAITNVFAATCNNSNLWTFGSTTSLQQHGWNTSVKTNGGSVGTLTNAPSAGNPTGFVQWTINGTTSYIPYWQ